MNLYSRGVITNAHAPLVIGVAGGTGAGKSLLVERLAVRLSSVCVIDLDSYYRDRVNVPAWHRAQINFDEPDAFDIDLLLEHLRRLRRGEAVEKPIYSFHEHTRCGSATTISAPVILVEGLFALWWSGLREQLDLTVFVDSPADLRLARRIQRDAVERGRSVESVLSQYLGTVRHMHDRYVAPTRAFADLVVPNDGSIESGVGDVVAALEKVTGSHP